jgi:hypothetical protein
MPRRSVARIVQIRVTCAISLLTTGVIPGVPVLVSNTCKLSCAQPRAAANLSRCKSASWTGAWHQNSAFSAAHG